MDQQAFRDYEATMYVFDLNEDIQGSNGRLERGSLEEPLRFLQDLFDAVPSHEEFILLTSSTSMIRCDIIGILPTLVLTPGEGLAR